MGSGFPGVARRAPWRRTAVATAVVVSVLVGPLPLLPIPVGPGAAALACGTAVDAATVGPDPVAATAALQAAIDGASSADGACAAWTVTLTGTFVLADDLVHRAPVPLVLSGQDGGRGVLRGDGSARLVTLLRPATELTLRRLELRDGDAVGTDLGGAGGAVGAEVASLVDPRPSRVVVTDSLLAGSTASSGGAVAADVVVLTDVDLVGNSAPLGGAVDVGELTAVRAQFVANSATLPPAQGGAVRASGDVTLETVTMTGNAAGAGGSVWMSGGAGPVLRAVATTFADARADVGGHVRADGKLGGSVRLVLGGSVLVGVTALTEGAAAPAVCDGPVVLGDPGPDASPVSLATDASCPGAAVLDTEPVLVVLAGPAGTVEGLPRLLVPAADGPLVDLADCGTTWPAADARGLPRPQPAGGACDAGAVEVAAAGRPAPPPPSSPPAPSDGSGAAAEVADGGGADDLPPVPSAVRSGAADRSGDPVGILRRLRRR